MSRQRGASVLAAIILILVFALAALIISVFFPKTSADTAVEGAQFVAATRGSQQATFPTYKCAPGYDYLYIVGRDGKPGMLSHNPQDNTFSLSTQPYRPGSEAFAQCPKGFNIARGARANVDPLKTPRFGIARLSNEQAKEAQYRWFRYDLKQFTTSNIGLKMVGNESQLYTDRCSMDLTSPTEASIFAAPKWERCGVTVCETKDGQYDCTTTEVNVGDSTEKPVKASPSNPPISSTPVDFSGQQQYVPGAEAKTVTSLSGGVQGAFEDIKQAQSDRQSCLAAATGESGKGTCEQDFKDKVSTAQRILQEKANESNAVAEACAGKDSKISSEDCADAKKAQTLIKLNPNLLSDPKTLTAGEPPCIKTSPNDCATKVGGGGTPPPAGPGNTGNTFRDLGNMAQSMNNAMGNNQCAMTTTCQGGMLVRQVPMPIYSNGQTMTMCQSQPLQQCPYGCAPAGSMTTGQQLSLIGTGMSLAGRLFGSNSGTNNNSSIGGMGNLASIGASTQCATQQQAMQQMQQQSPYGIGQNGSACTQPPAQPSASGCTVGTWKQTADNNGCASGWQCIPNGTGTDGSTPAPAAAQPLAQLSCEPKSGEAGTSQISLSYNCANSTTASAQEFTLNGTDLSGTVRTQLRQPASSTETMVNYSLTCANAAGVTSVAQCSVKMVKPGIVFVINPLNPKKGSTANLGWVTAGMQSCKISSDVFPDWTQQQAKYSDPNGVAQTPAITQNTQFRLSCTTIGGNTKESQTTILPQY